jgi:hypothetical protein
MRLATQGISAACTRLFAVVGVALIAMSCGGGGDGSTTPRVVGSMSINPAAPLPIAAGGTLQLAVTVLDTKGLPMSGQVIAFSSSATNIASVSPQGQVSAAGPVGHATISAAIGAVTASVEVTVVAGASASLTRTSPDPGTVTPGANAGDSVRFVVKDAFGNPHAQETVTFNVSAGDGHASPASAQTDAQGRAATMFITGTTAGTNTLSATICGVPSVSFSVTTASGSVSIASVLPSPMTPGASVTIVGAGFDPNASGDAITIDGQAATVTSASPTQIVMTVPTTLPCTPAHQANVQVTANGAIAIARQALRVGAVRSLAVGGAVVLTDPANINCTELSPAGGRYVVNVLDASPIPTALTPFHFSGATSIPAGTTLTAPVFGLRQTARRSTSDHGFQLPGMQQVDRSSAHSSMLESNRLVLKRMKTRFPRSPRTSAKVSVLAPGTRGTAAVVAGDIRTFRVLQPSTAVGAAFSCSTNFVEITARAVYVGSRSIIYEDTKAPLAGQMDSYFAQVGQEFDTSMYPSDATYFGDPLVTDPYTDNDQHLNMVFTPSIPAALGGFVLSCDFFARNTTDNQVSNFGEIFYARVPTVAGTGFSTDNPDSWLRGMRAAIVHEVKHIASFGAHLVNNANTFEESWLEEGMAFVAEEVWARDRIYSGTWKGNMSYATTLYCDVRPTWPECTGKPYVMFDHYSRLYSALDVPGSSSLFGRVADNDFSFYAVSWSFIRYSADRYAASEVNFLQGITHALDVTGVANVARQSGADPDQMLGMWSLALYLDENTAMAGNADVGFPSWHTRDIFAGISHDIPSSFPKTYPLVPQIIGEGDFLIDNAGIHGGSFSAYDLLPLSQSTRTIGLSGGAMLRLVVARVQ